MSYLHSVHQQLCHRMCTPKPICSRKVQTRAIRTTSGLLKDTLNVPCSSQPSALHSSTSSNTNRAALSQRQLPEMTLSTGLPDSLTAARPVASFPSSPIDRARARFAVSGNAIFGGAGMLGLATAHALLEHGLSGLTFFDTNPSSSEAQFKALAAEFPAATVRWRKVDVTDEVAVAAGVRESAAEMGGVNLLLCFAGVVGCTHALDMGAAEWRRIVDVNTTGTFLCAQAVAREMVKQGTGGCMVFTASISGHRVNYPQPQVAYNVSKAALLTMKNGLAAEWARYGIRVCTISPGYANTILNEGEGLSRARRIWLERNPMGRMAEPDELTGAVVMLCSQAGSYITGTDIVIDGGQTLF